MEKAILHENFPLIEVAEPHILELLFQDKIASALLLTRLSDRVAVVAPGKLDDLQERLLKLGHTPKVVR